MSAKAVQISLDAELLNRIDADPEAQQRGRSAFIGSAVNAYLAAKSRRSIDERIRAAYTPDSNAMLDEVADMLEAQVWPTD
ncbi:MAG: hypothetical protein R3F39_09375 [Myxococcota bacterium]